MKLFTHGGSGSATALWRSIQGQYVGGGAVNAIMMMML